MKLSDEPSIFDTFERQSLTKKLAHEIITCKTPQVFGIHGPWGCGKTSVLHQLHLFLEGKCLHSLQQPQDFLSFEEQNGATNDDLWLKLGQKMWGGKWTPKEDIIVVWFEAWRYQYEQAPVVALLQEIRSQLDWKIKVTDKVKKLGEVAAYGALFGLESLTKLVGVKPSEVQKAGESWENSNYATQLPTHVIRALLNEEISKLIKSNNPKKFRLVVLIDDLDRCEAGAAYRLLEGIKIYLIPLSFQDGTNPRPIG
jgi:hypothetical protein